MRALESNEVAVGELARALQVPQSTASRLIKPLYEAGFVARRVEGTTSLYRADPHAMGDAAQALWELSRASVHGTPEAREDDARLAAVIASRPTDSVGFFGRVGGEWDSIRRDLFGEAGGVEALLSIMDPDSTVADVGCGTGEVSQWLAASAGRVVAIDREASMLEAARRRVAGLGNIEFRRGDVDSLPARDGEFDAVVAMLLFHHLDDPGRALRELARCTRKGGCILVVDMVEHTRASYRTAMGHRHLGFSEATAKEWAKGASVHLGRWRRLPPSVNGCGPGLFSARFAKR